MPTDIEASNGDKLYLNYKKNMEGMQNHDNISETLANVRVAIFGLGRIGTIHLDNLRRSHRVEVVYCVDESKERINFVRNKWKLTETKFLTPSEQAIIFEDESITGVIICTPTFTHEDLIMKSLELGKAVFCEKPLAVDEEGIERCLKTAKKLNVPLHCAFNRRFDPGVRDLKNRVDAGEIGKVQVVKMCSRDSPKPPIEYLKISGGIFHDCAVHDIDLICWILGEYPESISAYAHTHYEDIKALDDYDTVVITMKFPSGVLACVDLSRCAVYGYDQRVEVFGSNGMLCNGEQRPTAVRSHTGKGSTAVPIYFSFVSRYQEAYALEMEHFLNVAQGIEPCEVDFDSIIANSKIASVCEEAARTGNVIPFNWKNQKNGI